MIIKGNQPEPNTLTQAYKDRRYFLDNHVYIPILKNAHRLTTNVVKGYGFVLNNNVHLSNKTKLVVLRDPVERWYAGIAQFLYLNFPNPEVNDNIIDLLTRLVVLDGHSSSQSSYLKGFNTDECIFFNMDDSDYLENFLHYCNNHIDNIDNLSLPNQNWNTKVNFYLELKSKLKEFCTTNFKERLEKYYAEDYELLNTVKFYRGNI